MLRTIILALMLAFSLNGHAKNEEAAASNENVVKKSKAGIRHAPGGSYYENTKNFTPFKTLDECLKSGGAITEEIA